MRLLLSRITSVLVQAIKPLSSPANSGSTQQSLTNSFSQSGQAFTRAQPKKVESPPDLKVIQGGGQPQPESQSNDEPPPDTDSEIETSDLAPEALAVSSLPESIHAIETEAKNPNESLVSLINLLQREGANLKRWLGHQSYHRGDRAGEKRTRFRKGILLDQKTDKIS